MSAPTLSGLRWADVRLHRTTLRAAGALVLLAVVVTGLLTWASHAYPEPAHNCYAGGPCDTFLGFGSAEGLLVLAMAHGSVGMLLVPALAGAFVAGPMIGRELESGTYRLAWTQTASPARWLASKLTTAAGLTVGAGLVLMAAFRIGTSDRLGGVDLSRYDRGVYELLGPVLIAYCLLAVALGALTGLLVRRTLPALAASGIVTYALLFTAGSVRWDLFPAHTLTGPANGSGYLAFHVPADSMIMSMGVRNAAGRRFVEGQCLPDPSPGYHCPADTRITGWFADVHTPADFWYLQLAETAVVLALAAAAAYAAFRVLRRRTA